MNIELIHFIHSKDELTQLWEADSPLSERLQSEPLMDDEQGFTLFYSATGLPATCHLCGGNGLWLPEGSGLHKVFVCEHGQVDGLAVRKLSHVRADQVYIKGGFTLEDLK